MDGTRFDHLLRHVAVVPDRRALLGLLAGALLAARPVGRASAAPHPACVPFCAGKECGDDGCGGSCGQCLGNETCGGDGIPFQCGGGGGTGCRSQKARQNGKKQAHRCNNRGDVRCLVGFADNLAEAAACAADYTNCCDYYLACDGGRAQDCVGVVELEYGLPR